MHHFHHHFHSPLSLFSPLTFTLNHSFYRLDSLVCVNLITFPIFLFNSDLSVFNHLNTIPLCFFLRSKCLPNMSLSHLAYQPHFSIFLVTYISTLSPLSKNLLLCTFILALAPCSIPRITALTELTAYNQTSLPSLRPGSAPLQHLQN